MSQQRIRLTWGLLIVSFFVFGLAQPGLGQSAAQRAKMRAKYKAIAAKKAKQAQPKPPKILLPIANAPRNSVSIAPVDPSTSSQVKAAALQIDRIVADHLRSKGLQANQPISDATFMRRVYLDITGTIPTLEQAEAFLNSELPEKRSELIDQLLNSPGYASHHFNYWADVLRIVDKPDNNNYLRPYGDWVMQSLRDNTHWNQMVVEMLTAQGKVWHNPAAGYKLRDDGMPLDNLNNTVRIFLGTRIGCAQCHDHPFDRWTQREFYQLAAFEAGVNTRSFNRQLNQAKDQAIKNLERREIGQINRLVNMNRKEVVQTAAKLKFPHDYAYDDAKPGEVVKPHVIFGNMPQVSANGSPREAFAHWLTGNENPRFALTIANRMWQRVFGVGLIDPVDDLTDDTVASIPPLMEHLTAEMKRLDYDLKEFLRILYNTHIYQRASTVVDSQDPSAAYQVVGPMMRRMSAEQVWDSMLTLTLDDPDTLLRYDDADYVQSLDISQSPSADQLISAYPKMIEFAREERTIDRSMEYKSIVLRRASELPQPVAADHFLRQFGQSDRTIIADSSTDGTVPQLLTMFNGPITHMMLEPGSMLVEKVFARPTLDARIEAIYLSVLGRYPSENQSKIAKRVVAEFQKPGYGDVVWALLNTREFIFVQ